MAIHLREHSTQHVVRFGEARANAVGAPERSDRAHLLAEVREHGAEGGDVRVRKRGRHEQCSLGLAEELLGLVDRRVRLRARLMT